ncbi:class I SAM-dependent methyltransferase [Pectobacterium parvum]|uniref:Methyltransferase domain-containing protein n=2 Tax=Pectobacterium parvum TaxID=2778550 RepID=A0AAP9IKS1_9GAMM|nr:class I SAM-dependent methyltransferase [Pectobacterium parvum]QHQ25208.1 methyltransferase domain-containing protein [Pectobacterium parvum]
MKSVRMIINKEKIMPITNPIWTEKELTGHIDYNQDFQSIIEKNAWHGLFSSHKWILMNPADEVIDFYHKYIVNPSSALRNRFSLTGNKLHDLGCGGGRHLYYFAERGFDVTGSDLSENAINYTREELRRREKDAELVLCPMTALPFENNSFDITLSRAVINHATLQDVKKTIFEVARTTKPGGLFFVTFSSERASDWKKGCEVEPDVSYIPESGPEKGLVHTFLNAANTAALLEPFFRIEEIYLYEHPSWVTNAPGASDPNEYFGSEYVAICVRR